MSKIYGFGNALVDIEIQIDEDQLISIGIPKGSMKHIGIDEKEELLKKYKGSIKTKNPGGSIANSLFAAESFGVSTCFSCFLGDDDNGKIFIDSYDDESKISFKFSEKPTGVCLVFITPDGERTMASNLSANYQLSEECIDISKLKACEYLLFDNFSLATDSGSKTVDYCLDNINNDVKVCFGLSDTSLISENLEKIKKLSEKNIYCLSGNEYEHAELESKTEFICQNKLISFGKDGASINEQKVQAPEINLVNTNGAGDSLLGAFIALKNRLGDRKAIEKAVHYSTKICSVKGPRLI